MKKQIGKLQAKASQRHNNLVNKLDEVDNFESLLQASQRDVARANMALNSLNPVASDVKTIKHQQADFKVSW